MPLPGAPPGGYVAPREKESIGSLRGKLVLRGLLAGFIGGAVPGVLDGILVAMIFGAGGGEAGAVVGSIFFVIILGYSAICGTLIGLVAGLSGSIDLSISTIGGVVLCCVLGLVARVVLLGMGLFAITFIMIDVFNGAIIGYFVYLVYNTWMARD